jgi:hypothetical protein
MRASISIHLDNWRREGLHKSVLLGDENTDMIRIWYEIWSGDGMCICIYDWSRGLEQSVGVDGAE